MKKSQLLQVCVKLFLGICLLIPLVVMATDEEKILSQKVFTVSGTVSNELGDPLIGATVRAKDSNQGTLTNDEGKFTLEVPAEVTTLIISYIGYETQEVEIGGRTSIEVVLAASASTLDEVVVVGYGTQGKSLVSAAVTQINAEDLEIDRRPVTNVQSSLVGAVPGLILNSSTGRIGAGTEIKVRQASALQDRNALILIDGFEGSLDDVNPSDIASVSVLKDAAATAIFGARSANGVVLITTKNPGRNERVSLTYNGYFSIQDPAQTAELVNSTTFMEFSNEAALNEALRNNPGTDPSTVTLPFDQADLDRARSGFYPETQWVDELYSENAGQTSHNLTINGGGQRIGYLINLGFLDQNGLAIGSDNFERFTLRAKLDADITDWLTVGINAFNTNRNTNRVPATEGSNVRGRPFFPVQLEDGTYVDKGAAGGEPNPVGRATSGSYDKSNRDALNLQLYAQVEPIQDLVIEGRLSYVNANTFQEIWNTPYEFAVLDLELNPTGPNIPINAADRSLLFRSTREFGLNTLSTIRYTWDLNSVHNFNVLGGFQTQEGENVSHEGERFNFILSNLQNLSLGQQITEFGNNSSRGGNRSTLSYFGRLAYDFKGKYLAEFNFRADASSNFGPNNKWGYFPAVSVGWNLGEESFIRDLGFVNVLKLRASWGQNGDDGSINAIENVLFDPSGAAFGGNVVPTLALGDAINPDLKWETSEKINLALDMTLWNGKLGITAEYFEDQRSDIITVLLTSVEGGLGGVLDNVYDAKSWGWEIALSHDNNLGKFRYFANANLSYYDSEITNTEGVSPLNNSATNFQDIGLPILGNWFGWETDGFFDNQSEIESHVTPDGTPIDQSSVVAQGDDLGRYIGGYKYVDQLTVDTNGDGIPDAADGVINADDRVVLQTNSGDNYRIGFNVGMSYAGFSLAARFYGVLEGYEWWGTGSYLNPFTGDRSPFQYQTDTWRPDNPDAKFPAATASNIIPFEARVSDLIQDRSYIKLKNINLGYSFGRPFLDKVKIISGLDLYVSIENLGVIWTNYPAFDTGWDPELGGGEFAYPFPRTTTFGATIKF